jgi:multiple sugar transport system permease protein
MESVSYKPQAKHALSLGTRLKSKYLSLRFLARVLANIVMYVLIIGISFNIIYPIVVEAGNAFKSASDFRNPTVTFFSRTPSMETVNAVLTQMDIFGARGMRSLQLALLVSLLQVIMATLIAYGFARFKFKGNTLLFGAVILTLVVPPQTTILPLLLNFKSFDIFGIIKLITGQPRNLINTYVPQIILAATARGWKNGLYIFMLRQYFRGVPMVLEEAAYIDGAKTFKAFYRVMLPSAIPMMMTVFLFSFCWQWTDNFYVRLMPSEDLGLVASQVSSYYTSASEAAGHSSDITQGNYYTTSVIILIAPLILLFLFTQQFFVEGVERSGIVG